MGQGLTIIRICLAGSLTAWKSRATDELVRQFLHPYGFALVTLCLLRSDNCIVISDFPIQIQAVLPRSGLYRDIRISKPEFGWRSCCVSSDDFWRRASNGSAAYTLAS